MSKRLTAEERRGFARYARTMAFEPGVYYREAERYLHTPLEPALGTLAERLDIIIRRQGGKTGPIRLTAAERADFEREQRRYRATYEDQELAA